MSHVIYLRKSRADAELESRGEGETLARHEKTLLACAKRLSLNIGGIYRELVSGETISARPQMQKLLSEVGEGAWDGVLVMEIERLARGDTVDQGLVLQAFKSSGTKIITPSKSFDPNNEFDEEYFEFGLFMSRREYKTINRRMQRGREASVKEGKFLGSRCAYGYRRVKLPEEKGWTLEIIPEKAEIVREIFRYYTQEHIGTGAIASRLNQAGISPPGKDYWLKSSVYDILNNPIYIGKVRWGYHPRRKKIIDGSPIYERLAYDHDCVIAPGLHEKIISEEIFLRAQEILKTIPPAPCGYKKELKNALSGLIFCSECGRSMAYRRPKEGSKKAYLVCHARECPTVSSPQKLVETRLLCALQRLVYEIKTESSKQEKNTAEEQRLQRVLANAKAKHETLQRQQTKLHNLLEQGVYSVDTFLERSAVLKKDLEELSKQESELEKKISLTWNTERNAKELIPKITHLLETYQTLDSPGAKNSMLKEVVARCMYTKSQEKRGQADSFELVLQVRTF